VWIAVVLLAPGKLLAAPPGALAARWARARERLGTPPVAASLVLGSAAAGVLALVGFLAPLPGARWAGALLSAVALAQLAWRIREGALGRAAHGSLTTLLCACALWLGLTRTAVPFDYYRRAAGELGRMGRIEDALAMYRRAERYAPAGRSRAATIRTLELELARQRARRK
jgi:hypothetical protein